MFARGKRLGPGGMLRVTSANVLVVPPFECAWLEGDPFELKSGRGCLAFHARGDNDVTIVLVSAPDYVGKLLPRKLDGIPYYRVIIGSHGNRKLKVEKNGETVVLLDWDTPQANLLRDTFAPYWLDISPDGVLALGIGMPGCGTPLLVYSDPDPIPLSHVGLSSWDAHISVRDISVLPCLADMPAPAAQPPAPQLARVPPLANLCQAAAAAGLCARSAVWAASAAQLCEPLASELRTAAVGYLCKELGRVVRVAPNTIASLPYEVMADLVSSPHLVVPELRLFQATALWADAPGREAETESLLAMIKFPLMARDELEQVATHPLVWRSPKLQALLSEAMHVQMSEDGGCTSSYSTREGGMFVEEHWRVRTMSSSGTPGPDQGALEAAKRRERRVGGGATNLTYISDGDCNGVLHYLGTAYGTRPWSNPSAGGSVTVSASGPCSRYCDPKNLTDRRFHSALSVGRNAAKESWWKVDLGPEHRLIVNYYTLRHDGSSDFMRCWALQGSCDGDTWQDLRVHTDDRGLSAPGKIASWAVNSLASARPFRLFRIALRGRTTSLVDPWRLALSNIELYGYLHVRGDGNAAMFDPDACEADDEDDAMSEQSFT